MTNGLCATEILIIGKPLHFLFCSGSWSISSGQCGLIELSLQFNVQLESAVHTTRQHLIQPIEVLVPVVFADTRGVAHSGTAVSFKGRCTAQRELLRAITNCHCARVGERHKLVCVYSLTDPLMPATPPVSLLCPNLSGGLTGPG